MNEKYPTVEFALPRRNAEEMTRDVRSFQEMLGRRRTVRDFSADDVPQEVIEAAIATAASAPSGANLQPWSFIVVRDATLKQQIREAAEKEEYDNYHGRMPADWLHALAPLQTDWHKEFLEIAPVLIAVFKQDYSIASDGTRVTHYYVNESVGIACGFLLAALNAAGLATLTHTPSPMGFLREILGRPKTEKPFLLIPVGFPAPGCRVPDITKKSLSQVMTLR